MNLWRLFLNTRVVNTQAMQTRSPMAWLFAAALACAVLSPSGARAEVLRLPGGAKWSTSLSENVRGDSIHRPRSARGEETYWFHLIRDRGRQNNFRTELAGQEPGLTRHIIFGTHYRARFLLHTPPDWQADNKHEIVWQLHRVPDPKERGKPGQPLASLRISGTRFVMNLCYSSATVSFLKKDMECTSSAQFGDLAPNRAYAFELDYRLTRGTLEQGHLGVTLDGQRVYAYQGPVGYDDRVGPYMKFGIYKAPWRPKHNQLTSTHERRYGFSGVSVIRIDQPTDPVTASPDAEGQDTEGPSVSSAPTPLPRRQLPAAQSVQAPPADPTPSAQAVEVAPTAPKPLREQAAQTRQTQEAAAVLRKRNRTHGGASGALHRAIQQWQKMERWSD